jgi:hypothetical protein
MRLRDLLEPHAMPTATQFWHQQYRSTAPTSPHHLLAPRAALADPADDGRRWTEVARAYRAAGVSSIYLVQGGLPAADAAQLLGALARAFPLAAGALGRLRGELSRSASEQAPSYTGSFARGFERAINSAGGARIPVRLLEWSSENNHLGRADAAVRLVAQLASTDLERGGRVLLWAHGHAGNVLALLTQLLARDPQTADAFFSAAEVYYRWPLLGWIDIPLWRRVRGLLSEHSAAFANLPLDLVTFGTPVLYGWNHAGYRRLLHVVYHRPAAGLPVYQAPFPPAPERISKAADGDYVQQFGIAGTGVPPTPFAWRARLADRRLGRLLEAGLSADTSVERFRAGTRVAESGTTLLVDYGATRGTLADHRGGHAVYAQPEWLLFHAEETARRFYQPAQAQAA